MTDYIVNTYLFYLPIALILTFVVARIFFSNSKIFMLDIFSGRQEIALSTNKLFQTGFYLLSLGFALFTMKVHTAEYTRSEETLAEGVRKYTTELFYGKQEMFEVLSSKVGVLAVVLGFMVFFLMFMLFRGKRKSAENKIRHIKAQQA